MTDDNWTVQDAKAQLSELMRRARAGEPQLIGTTDPCVLISKKEWQEAPVHLGRWLVQTAPRGAEFEVPPRDTGRGNPFEDDA
jgi:prevent-host-death family protein